MIADQTDTFILKLIRNINHHVLGKQTDTYDLLHMAKILASADSAQYLMDNMSNARNFGDGLSLLSHAMNLRTHDGLILEFGVASGRTINHIASLTDQAVFGFDGFTGLPEDWRTGFPKGAFSGSLQKVKNNVELVVGYFEDTLPTFLASAPDKTISLLHVDCDLYSSTKTIFQSLGSRILPGTVIVFDEYFNYPGWRRHEFKAFQEFITESRLSYGYEAFVSKHQQVCVRIT